MGQLLAQAQSRELITAEEAAEPDSIDPEKRVQILAQATVESVTAFQLPLRRKKKEEIGDGTLSKGGDDDANSSLKSPESACDQVIMLKDFPQNSQELKAMVDLGFD